MRVCVLVLFLSTAVFAVDLENILEGKSDSQQSQGSSYLSMTLMGMLKTTTAEQNVFLRAIEKMQWSDALVQWNNAFGGSEFEKSVDGKALYSLLQFRSGLALTGIESLFSIEEPKKIHFQLINMWRESAPVNHGVWTAAKIKWKSEWAEIFGPAIAVRVMAADIFSLKNKEELQRLSLTAPIDSKERALIDWNLAIAHTLNDESDKAAKIVASLLKAKNNPVPEDLLMLTAARMLYQNGYFDAAIKYYDKVPKSSEDYLEAQEEKAWAYVRRGEPQNALAITQTLIHPSLTGQVGPESWFVRSLSQLKICDYPGALESLVQFPKEFKQRTLELEKVAQNADLPNVKMALDQMKKEKLKRADLVKIHKYLPRNMARDERLRILLSISLLMQAEAESAEKLYARSLQITGLQGHFDSLKGQILQRHLMANNAAVQRVQELAKIEVEETKKILTKLHIVEAEVIQQVEAASKLMKHLSQKVDTKSGTTGASSKDVLKFPMEKEVWFDELTNYRVNVKKGCQAKASQAPSAGAVQ